MKYIYSTIMILGLSAIPNLNYHKIYNYLFPSKINLMDLANISFIENVKIYPNQNAILTTNNTRYVLPFGDLGIFETKISKLLPKIPIIFEHNDNIFYKFSGYIPHMIGIFIICKSIQSFSKVSSLHGINNSKAKLYKNDSKIKMDDVVGISSSKEQIVDIIDMIKNPDIYKNMGVKIPKGLLLSGKPGTGKTRISKAIANETGVNFYYISGADFNCTFVGVGTARLQDMYKTARENAPSIIFIDEIDAIGKQRNSKTGHEERENTLNALLVEMDGFEEHDNVLLIGATNKEDMLDKALTRPGRFDRIINFELPSKSERVNILNYYLGKIPLDCKDKLEDYSDKLALYSRGYSAAELSNICNEASIYAIKCNRTTVDWECLEYALDYVLLGPINKSMISEKERERIAYHEAGHALISVLVENTNIPNKVSILPRSKGVMGFSQTMITEERVLTTNEELLATMHVLIGGRCAESLIYNNISTGAQDDIDRLNKIAYQYITLYGMGTNLNTTSHNYSEYYKNDSEIYTSEIQDEIINLISETNIKVEVLLKSNLQKLTKIKDLLMEKNTIYYKELMSILEEDSDNNK